MKSLVGVIAMSTVLLAVNLISSCSAASVFECPICSGGGCPEPSNCRYGIAFDHCKNRVCAKGPGEICGGDYKMLGICGDGMACRCRRCSGCSLHTFECYDHTCN